MHIKQVIIDGFKSYKDQIAVEEFSPKLNTVVGANGSGKSNFFAAIRFVLDTQESSGGGRQDERKDRLLHEGTGHAVPQAWVEIVFDNSDHRLPSDASEVRLRRTITLKKDEYSVNSKHISKKEVQQWLESAGFSRANPYNIVEQGKITRMSQMKDAERLEMLKEVGGARVYETKRKESKRTMEAQSLQLQNTDSTLKTIRDRLTKLDAEKEELREYHNLDKKRRAIEYCILEADRQVTLGAIHEAKHTGETISRQAQRARDQQEQARDELHSMKSRVTRLQGESEAAERNREATQVTADERASAHAALQYDIQELTRHVDSSKNMAEYNATETARLAEEVAAKESQLEELKASKNEAQVKLDGHKKEREEVELAMDALFSKQGRESKFDSAADRDAWIDGEVQAITGTLREKRQEEAALKVEIQELDARVNDISGRIGDMQEQKRAKEEERKEVADSVRAAKDTRSRALDRRKAAWTADAEVKAAHRVAEDAVKAAKQSMWGSVPDDLASGVNNLRFLVREHNIEGVYGTLIDLVSCAEKFFMSVERVAGNRLFHVAVRDDEVAAKCIGLLNERRLGRLTFLPVNRLRVPSVNRTAIDRYSGEVILLISKLQFDPEVELAVRSVWGKVLLARDSDIAVSAARDCDMECVVMAGDKFSSKGTIDGGYVDVRRLRMTNYAHLKAKTQEHSLAQDAQRTTAATITELDTENSRAETILIKVDKHSRKVQRELSDLAERITELQAEEATLQEEAKAQHSALHQMQSRIASLEAQQSSMKQELGKPLAGALTADEQSQLQALQSSKDAVLIEIGHVQSDVRRFDDEVHNVQQSLVSLRKTIADLEGQVQVADVDQALLDVESKTRELAELEGQLESDKAAAIAARQAAVSALEVLETAKADLETKDAEQVKHGNVINDEVMQLNDFAQQQAQLQAKLSDLERRCRDLGALSDDAHKKVRNKSVDQLKKALKSVNADLDKYSGSVNKKALDEFTSFAEQQTSFDRRRRDLAAAEESIKRLMTTLDLRKNECLERTFKGVAKHFQQIFKQLVPGNAAKGEQGGSGNLVMVRSAGAEADEDEDDEDDDEAADPEDKSSRETYIGVKVKVSFDGNETMSMHQLSGGQRTIVSLALIFAIQRSDPAPFYLLDEVDAALDPQYRTTVATMLRQQSNDAENPAQFIITTFQPEIVQVADKSYGVTHSHRISKVNVVTREKALEFVAREAATVQAEDPSGRTRKRQKERA